MRRNYPYLACCIIMLPLAACSSEVWSNSTDRAIGFRNERDAAFVVQATEAYDAGEISRLEMNSLLDAGELLMSDPVYINNGVRVTERECPGNPDLRDMFCWYEVEEGTYDGEAFLIYKRDVR